VVGKRQAITFNALAALSGHGEAFVPRATSPSSSSPAAARPKSIKTPVPTTAKAPHTVTSVDPPPKVGLTVRIEVNLPANGDQKTYDAIFQSIRKNLIDGD
jgi:hypothetical protein